MPTYFLFSSANGTGQLASPVCCPPFFRITLIILLCSLLLPLSATAHKLRIFAWSEGDVIHGETAFSGKRKPKNAEVTVFNAADKKVLLTTATDTKGRFSFVLPEQAVRERLDLLLVVNSGEGHRGEWPLPASEYLAGSGDSQDAADEVPVIANEKAVNPEPLPHTAAVAVSMDEEQLRQIIASELTRTLDRELDKKLAPLKQLVAENSDKEPGLQDVLGGIGYIMGIAGLLAWLQSRKKMRALTDRQ
jgi:nickel transport protein